MLQRAHHQDVYLHVKTHGGKKSQLSAFLEEVCSDIEAKDGRGEPEMEIAEDLQKQKEKEEKESQEKEEKAKAVPKPKAKPEPKEPPKKKLPVERKENPRGQPRYGSQ